MISLVNLKLEEDVPVELEDKVTNMEILLKEGNRLYEDTVKLFGSLKQKLSDAKRKTDDLRGIFEILDITKTIQSAIGSSDKYHL